MFALSACGLLDSFMPFPKTVERFKYYLQKLHFLRTVDTLKFMTIPSPPSQALHILGAPPKAMEALIGVYSMASWAPGAPLMDGVICRSNTFNIIEQSRFVSVDREVM